MRDRILKTTIGAYKATEWWGQNTAGFQPVGDMVLVLPDEAVNVSTGGIIIPETVTDTNTMAAESGVVVAIGTGAFVWTATGRAWSGPKPEVGDRVRMQRYSGQLQAGRDGHAYRLMTDTCIGAIEEAAEESEEKPIPLAERGLGDPWAQLEELRGLEPGAFARAGKRAAEASDPEHRLERT